MKEILNTPLVLVPLVIYIVLGSLSFAGLIGGRRTQEKDDEKLTTEEITAVSIGWPAFLLMWIAVAVVPRIPRALWGIVLFLYATSKAFVEMQKEMVHEYRGGHKK